MQVLAATVGQTAPDFLDTKLNLGLTVTSCIMTGVLIVALAVQFRSPRYVPSTYWICVVMIGIVGTLISDNLTKNLGVSRQVTTVLLAIAMIGTFAAWYASQRTLSIRTIFTLRREAFYWLAILFTFALGTAAADLLAKRFGVDYWRAVFLFGCLVLVVCIARFMLKMNSVGCFWVAYILTWPLGASLGDLVSQRRDGGLGFGTTTTSLVFLAAILTLATCLTVGKVGTVGRHARPPSRTTGPSRYMRHIRRAGGE